MVADAAKDRKANMYIGGGVLVTILIVLLIIFLAKRV